MQKASHSLRLIYCSMALLSFSTFTYAQRNALTDQRSAKFVTFFNAGQTDSLYSLLSAEVQAKLPKTTLTAAQQQLKGLLGSLVSTEYFNTMQGMNVYIGVFEKSGPVLYLVFNQENRIISFTTNADRRERAGNFTVKTPDATIKGTLSIPEGSNPVPVVVLIAGSGPTDRDGNSILTDGKSNYFIQISDALKANHIAVYRYDKRGVGQSTAVKPAADFRFEDFIGDAAAVIKTLKADKRFSKVIVAGHSEGSLIGMIAAEREKADAFISLEGAGTPIDVVLKTQMKAGAPAAEYPGISRIIDSIKAGHFTKQKLSPELNGLFNPGLQPYLYSWMKYDPRQEIGRLNLPVLIVQGTHDVQVGVADAQALKKADPRAQLKLIEGMSHILKQAPAERQANLATYSRPDLPLHPELIPVLTQFITSLK